jgi:hypothetical protein
MMNGTYAAHIGEIREEVEAEWGQADSTLSSQLKSLEEPTGQAALLRLVRDPENADALGRLARYEVSLMNAVTRTLQHLNVLQACRNTTKVISV